MHYHSRKCISNCQNTDSTLNIDCQILSNYVTWCCVKALWMDFHYIFLHPTTQVNQCVLQPTPDIWGSKGVYLNWANLQSNTKLLVSTYIDFLVITKLLDIAWETWCYTKCIYWHIFHALIWVWLYLNVIELTDLLNSIVEITQTK